MVTFKLIPTIINLDDGGNNIHGIMFSLATEHSERFHLQGRRLISNHDGPIRSLRGELVPVAKQKLLFTPPTINSSVMLVDCRLMKLINL